MSVSSLYMTGFIHGAGYVDIFDIAVIYHRLQNIQYSYFIGVLGY